MMLFWVGFSIGAIVTTMLFFACFVSYQIGRGNPKANLR